MNLGDSFKSNPFPTSMLNQTNAQKVTGQSFKGVQIIKESTHILENSSSCIDLIFTNEPNMVVESRVHHPLHQDCHHQIIFPKFNLKVH